MKNKKVLITSTLLLIICFACIFNAFAHSGRTDGNGGHRDNSNQSGLGSYHYHCGGYPAHLHKNGVCPYKSSGNSSSTSKSSSSSNDKYDEGYADGYDEGYDEGYNEGCEEGHELGYAEGHSDGYDEGYNESYDEHLEQYEELENLKAEKLKKDEAITTLIIVLIVILLFLGYKALWSKRR